MSLNFSFEAGKPGPRGRAASGPGPKADDPFRILLVGDFSGRARRGAMETGPALAARKPARIDLDNLDQVMTKVGVEVDLPGAEGAKDSPGLRFFELDDFTPDAIFDRLEVFQELHLTRKRLGDSATFDAAAAQVRSWAGTAAPPQPPQPPRQPEPTGRPGGGADLLGKLLGKPGGLAPRQTPPPPSAVDAILRQAVARHVVPDAAPDQADLVRRVEEAMTARMRRILGRAALQAAEAAWRSVSFLVSRLELDEGDVQLYLLDVSKVELAADLAAGETLSASGAYKLLVEQTVRTPGAVPWAVVVGLYTFDRQAEDVALLVRLASVMAEAGAPFLAAASPHVVGCESFATAPDPDDWRLQPDPDADRAWAALRKLPQAAAVGLTMPRLLLRLPYGRDTEPCERFGFEELPPADDRHEQYLWGNGAVAVACQLARAFHAAGSWQLGSALSLDVEDLPMHVWKVGGERHVKPCCEALLTETAAERIIAQGLIPLLSIKAAPTGHIAGVRSIADPPSGLVARWS